MPAGSAPVYPENGFGDLKRRLVAGFRTGGDISRLPRLNFYSSLSIQLKSLYIEFVSINTRPVPETGCSAAYRYGVG